MPLAGHAVRNVEVDLLAHPSRIGSMLTRIFPWLAPLILAACAARAPLAPVAFDLSSISPRHRTAFVGLLAALEDQHNKVAEDILAPLIARLESEADREGEAWMADAAPQLLAAKRLRRVLRGRKRLASLQFQLAVQGERGAQSLILTIKSRWPAPLELRPGPAMLHQHALLIGSGGEGSEMARTVAMRHMNELQLDPLGSLQVDLGPYNPNLLGGALGLRETFVLRMGAGGVWEGGEVYPAQLWPEARGMQIHLAAFLPNGVLPPSELVRQVTAGRLGMSALVERAIRIKPEHYTEALRGLRGPVNRATPEMFGRMEPLLRWLCHHDPQPSGLEAWREHLARLSQG